VVAFEGFVRRTRDAARRGPIGDDTSWPGRLARTIVTLTSVPLIPRERWWTRLAKLPGRLWSMSGELATLMTDGFHRQPSKRKLVFIRLAVIAGLTLLAPILFLIASRFRRSTAFDALHGRVRQIWQTSASEAIAFLRTTYENLVSQGAFTKMKAVEIPPFGSFGIDQTLRVQQFLYECEVAVGNYEEALAMAAALPGRLDFTILQQVDCLVALGRRAEAIALLERNLDLDGWRGKLHRRIVELGGRPLRAVN
jgi:hypothetical protein